MVTFFICILLLFLGYRFHSRYIETRFGVSEQQTPAYRIDDGVDFIALPTWRVFFIELLNIAGLGPIFGALTGALWGPIALLWVTFGTIFIGSVHDYLSGMISLRNNGSTLGDTFGIYFGESVGRVFRLLTIIVLILIGVVFMVGAAELIVFFFETQGVRTRLFISSQFWFGVVLLYFLLASYISVDRIIGKIYPYLGLALLFMGVGVFSGILFGDHSKFPEVWEVGLHNLHPQSLPIFPFLFVTIACGAVSGFHATQSPLAARCLASERMGRPVFAGSMYAEGVIALIWAGAGCCLYQITDGQTLQLASVIAHGQAAAVYEVCVKTLGEQAVLLTLLGVIACPISSGDTAFRAARMGLEGWLRLDPKNSRGRFLTTVVVVGSGVLISQLDYDVLWRYFAWFNQTLAASMLWLAVEYMCRRNKPHWFVSVPASFMTFVSASYLLLAPECLGQVLKLNYVWGVGLGGLVAAIISGGLLRRFTHSKRAGLD